MTKTPVCVLGLGLIGGSVLRAAVAAGHEGFGYNRSYDGAAAARRDGFATSTELARALSWAAERAALIVVAVPMPVVTSLLGEIAATAPDCPLTDVISVKGPVRDEVRAAGLLDRYVGGHPMAGTAHSGWPAGNAGLFQGAPWVVSVDDHVDPVVWSQVTELALDCGSFVVPARSAEHDAAAASISHLPHLLAEALATEAGNVPLAFSLAAGSFRDGTRVASTNPDLVRAMCEANARELLPALDRYLTLLHQVRDSLAERGTVAELAEAGHGARVRFESFSRPDIVAVVPGAPNWRNELAAAGRAGGVIRSALPAPGSPG